MKALSDSNFNVDFADGVSFRPLIIGYLRLNTGKVCSHIEIVDSSSDVLLEIWYSGVAKVARMDPLWVILFYIFVNSDYCEIYLRSIHKISQDCFNYFDGLFESVIS